MSDPLKNTLLRSLKLTEMASSDSKKASGFVRKLLGVFIALLLLLGLYTAGFEWYFNPSRHPKKAQYYREELKKLEKLPRYRSTVDRRYVAAIAAEIDERNAAKYLLSAWLNCKEFPEEGPVCQWYYRSDEMNLSELLPALQNVVNEHENVFPLLKEGLKQPILDLEKYDSFATGVGGFHRIFGDLAMLLTAKAATLEQAGDAAGAAETYGKLLHLARLISDGGDFTDTIMSLSIERTALDHIDLFVERSDDLEALQNMNEQLIAFSQGWPSASTLVIDELDRASKIPQREDFPPEGALYVSELPENPQILDYVTDTCSRTAQYLFGQFFLRRHVRKFEKYARETRIFLSKPYPDIIKTLKKDIDFSKPHPFREAFDDKGVFVGILAPALYKGMFTFMKAETDRRGAVLKTCLRIYRLQHGEYPETLEELDSLPGEMIQDPFSSAPLIYKKSNESNLLYSVGFDLDDDGGEPMGRPLSPGADGDIVFNVIPATSPGSA